MERSWIITIIIIVALLIIILGIALITWRIRPKNNHTPSVIRSESTPTNTLSGMPSEITQIMPINKSTANINDSPMPTIVPGIPPIATKLANMMSSVMATTTIIPGIHYVLKHVATGLALTVDQFNNGSQIFLEKYQSKPGQSWIFSMKSPDTYIIFAQPSRLDRPIMDFVVSLEGGLIILEKYNHHTNQHWKLIKSGHYFRIINLVPSYYLGAKENIGGRWIAIGTHSYNEYWELIMA
jgi:flagellar basal body-associated protein FliL